jgi:aminoglycoside phosphotransferase (APT) family kinase protein
LNDFENQLATVLSEHIEGFEVLISAERLSGGASQETYRIEMEAAGERRLLAMRRAPGGDGPSFAATKRARPGLRAEALMMRCAREAGIPAPEVFWVLEADDRLGEGFLMEWLEGEGLGPRIVRSPDFAEIRPKLARQIGEVLARIHDIDLDATGLRSVLHRSTAEEFLEETWGRYKAMPTPQPMIDYAGRWLQENLPDTDVETLVHNDFRVGNLMVSATEGIEAVLDWEIAHVGDPMRDLGWVCTNSWRFGSDLPAGGVGSYEELFAGYESVSGRPVDRDKVKFWEVFGSFWWSVSTLGMAEHYRTGPDKSVERAAIGRRTSECQVDCVNLLIPGPVELVEPSPSRSNLDMPRLEELVESVRDYLRGDVMSGTKGRLNFLARVSGNALDIVVRELSLAGRHHAAEQQRLTNFLGADDDLEALRWRLVEGLREGSIALDLPGLAEHLRATVVNQIAIDQPKYSGFRRAVDHRP